MQIICFDNNGFHDNFVMVKDKILGKGFDSCVRLVQEKKSQQYFALKCLSVIDPQHVYNFRNEIHLYHMIQYHQHIVHFYGFSSDYSTILLEFMPYNLMQIIQPNGVPIQIANTIMFQLMTAVRHMHSRNIIHGDLKPENALISQNFIIKLCDFGFAKLLQSPDTKINGGSEGFTAPEIRIALNYDPKKCDVFSLGIVYFILILGYRPFLSNHPYKQDTLWMIIQNEQWERFWEIFQKTKQINSDFKECFQLMVCADHNKRIVLDEALGRVSTNRATEEELAIFIKERLQQSI